MFRPPKHQFAGGSQPLPRVTPETRRRTRAAVIGVALVALLFFASLGWVDWKVSSLPDPSQAYIPGRAILIYDRSGQVLAEEDPQGQYHVVLKLDEMGRYGPAATLAAEDRDFYKHGPVDPIAVARAFAVDVTTGSTAQGGSTITQQLVKVVLLGSEKTLSRKVEEVALAYQMEHRYSKRQILEMYLNRVYYGHGAYGLGSATKTYFGAKKQASELTPAQSALLAALLQAPTYYDPFLHFDRLRERQVWVLHGMVSTGSLTQAEEQRAEQENVRSELTLDLSYRANKAPHFSQWVVAELERQLGSATVHQGGLAVYTTLDSGLQALAESAVTTGVGELGHTGVNNGDLLAAKPDTGEIRAWVGSADYGNQSIGGAFDVVVSPRQPGSSFKPYVYMSALRDRKITWASCLKDSPQNFGGYTPHDFDGRSLGTISARTAILRSRNIPAVQVASMDGIQNAINLAHAMGIKSDLDPSLPTAIGASDVTLFEHLQGYQTFADQGVRVPLFGVVKVVDRNGSVLVQNKPGGGASQVLNQSEAFLMNDTLKDYPRTWNFPWNRTMAAKTGTTDTGNGQGRDAWIMAYNPDIVAGAWVGQTGPDGKGGTISAYGELVADTVMAHFVNGLPATMRDWYNQRPAGVVSKGGYDYFSGTENTPACPGGEGGPGGEGHGHGNGGEGGGGD